MQGSILVVRKSGVAIMCVCEQRLKERLREKLIKRGARPWIKVELGLSNGWAKARKSEIPKIASFSEFCRRRAGAPPPSRERAMSLSWRLRKRVARAHHLGRAGAPPTETSPLSKGGHVRTIMKARARGQRWIGLFLASCPFSLLLLFFLASLRLFLYTLGLKFTSTHIKAPSGRRFKQFTYLEANLTN
ncbi:hypothetical protein PIB30_028558 [Stylosanthes scabra]|uniref:Uncharacterized protein n=1 Tax=Stylosanthes scabra TaxID=79078 RepID=A0ABU6TCV2_9FABA|nr:hypothetical protein [Stylosanthes scabra]